MMTTARRAAALAAVLVAATLAGARAQPPSEPELCRDPPSKCATQREFETYALQVAGETRYFTVYVPEPLPYQPPPGPPPPPGRRPPYRGPAAGANPPRTAPPPPPQLPVLIYVDRGARDDLGRLQMRYGSPLVNAANRYGFAVVAVSTPRGSWSFGNDGEVNFADPQPCTAESNPTEAPYLQAIFRIINGDEGVGSRLNATDVYIQGFSQNAMFAAYAAYCYPRNVRGLWQGGSGLAFAGEPPVLPGGEGQCSSTDYRQLGFPGCLSRPFDGEFFPIWPCYSPARPMVHCIGSYDNDDVVYPSPGADENTARNMYDASVGEGNDVRLITFKSSPGVRGGHSEPRNNLAWVVGCLGIAEPQCSADCGAAFSRCVRGRRNNGRRPFETFRECEAQLSDRGHGGGIPGCEEGCAPTEAMLKESEPLTTVVTSRGDFGAGGGAVLPRPETSQCVSERA